MTRFVPLQVGTFLNSSFICTSFQLESLSQEDREGYIFLSHAYNWMNSEPESQRGETYHYSSNWKSLEQNISGADQLYVEETLLLEPN